jgi:hypothetical protein
MKTAMDIKGEMHSVAFCNASLSESTPRRAIHSPRSPRKPRAGSDELPRSLAGLVSPRQHKSKDEASRKQKSAANQELLGELIGDLRKGGDFGVKKDWFIYPEPTITAAALWDDWQKRGGQFAPGDFNGGLGIDDGVADPPQMSLFDEELGALEEGDEDESWDDSDDEDYAVVTGKTLDDLVDENEEDLVDDETAAQRRERVLQRGRRRSSVQATYGEIMEHLRRIQWFWHMPDQELIALMNRAQHRFVPKWTTIIREGATGSVFYVLLKGAVRVTSHAGLDIVLREGVSFGEGALVTMVRREATVMAIEPCHMVQITAQACDGLSADLEALQCHVRVQRFQPASTCAYALSQSLLPA